MTNRYEEASDAARQLLEDFDEIDLAEMLASSKASAVAYKARIAELEQVARGYCPECGRGDCAPTVEDWDRERKRAEQANAWRRQANQRAFLLSRHQGLLVAIREFVAEETTPTNGWGDGYRDAKRDLGEILDAFAPDAGDRMPEATETVPNP